MINRASLFTKKKTTLSYTYLHTTGAPFSKKKELGTSNTKKKKITNKLRARSIKTQKIWLPSEKNQINLISS